MTVRIDQSDEDDESDRTHTADSIEASDAPAANSDADEARPDRFARSVEYRATVDAAYRAHAIDRAYQKICEIERGTVTPAMRRIEAEDPDRHLARLENRLKGKDRLAEKVTKMVNELGHPVDGALGLVKDSIRYTFCYPEERYTQGVFEDWDRMKSSGFQPVERENSWEKEQYKGINSRWLAPTTVNYSRFSSTRGPASTLRKRPTGLTRSYAWESPLRPSNENSRTSRSG